jgi:hypothetical protein
MKAPTIEHLRKTGWKVMVKHEKISPWVKGNPSWTWICVTDSAGNSACGTAQTHPNENYNRKLGNRIALGRAMTNWQHKNFMKLDLTSIKNTIK